MQIVRRVLASLAAVMLLVACTDDDQAQTLPTFTSPAGVYNDADVHFAQQMGPHHDQAVEMSKMVLAKQPPASTDVREIAEQIRATQESEIEIINGWLTAWGKTHAVGGHDGDHHGGAGVLSETEMQELDRADTPSGQRLFLDGVIRHHEGAVEMARTELRDGVSPAARQFAEQVGQTQTAQIAAMQRMRTQ